MDRLPRCCVAVLLACLAVGSGTVSAAPRAPDTAGLVAYLDGLDAMMQGRFTDAVAAFTRALSTNGDDPGFVLARGVAETLAEQWEPALGDLQRAQQLGLRGREAQLWTYAAEAMGGILTQEHSMSGFRGNAEVPAVVSIPGHMAQGRDDYPTDYGSFILYDLAQPYQKFRLPERFGGAGNPALARGPTMRAVMATAGRWFASRHMTRRDLAPAHLERTRQLHARKQYEAVLTEAGYARAAYPDDADVLFYIGESWLALGRPATARRELTVALTSRTDHAPSYLGRAMAAARLGDVRRTQADLAVAARLDAGAASRARSAIESELARQRVEGSPAHWLSALEGAARSAAPMDQLLAHATRVHKAAGAERLRYDELYQDRLRVLEDALRANPKTPDRYVDLAKYIVDEADNRGEKVEPRRPVVLYRWQASRETELGRAIQIVEDALRLDARHVGAMMQKAIALTALKRYDEAERIVDRALAIAGNNPDALRLYARFRAMRANQFSSEASGLRQERCSTSTRTETRSDGIYEIRTTTCSPPSQADLQRAAQLDTAATDLRRRAVTAMDAAIKVTKGTVEGYLLEADRQLWSGQIDQAQASLLQAITLDPRSLEAQEALADFYAKTGQQDKAEEQQAIARRLIHTTAAPLLRLAWGRIGKTAWQGAQGVLAQARPLDPEDARVPAYLGIALNGAGRSEDAVAALRTAVALEEARLRLDEPPARAGAPLGRDPIEFGLPMTARHLMAALLERAGTAADAVGVYRDNLEYEARIAPGRRLDFMYSAMLPDPRADPVTPPQPLVAAALVAQSHAGAARLLAALGRNDEAARAYAAVMTYAPLLGAETTGKPRIGTATEAPRDTREHGGTAVPEAAMWLAKQTLARGNADEADRWIREATGTWPPGYNAELQQLMDAIRRQLGKQRREDPSAGMPPERRAYADLQQRRDTDRRRMGLERMLANARVDPGLIGSWEMLPQNTFMPGRWTFTVEPNGAYTMVSQQDGTASRGRLNAQRGLIMMLESNGDVRELYYTLAERDTVEVMDLDSTKYNLTRRR